MILKRHLVDSTATDRLLASQNQIIGVASEFHEHPGFQIEELWNLTLRRRNAQYEFGAMDGEKRNRTYTLYYECDMMWLLVVAMTCATSDIPTHSVRWHHHHMFATYCIGLSWPGRCSRRRRWVTCLSLVCILTVARCQQVFELSHALWRWPEFVLIVSWGG